jgi:hypothetical protein
MIFRLDVLERIARGEVTLAFRRWIKAPPANGSTLRTPIGVVALSGVTVVRPEDVTEEDATLAGASSRQQLFAELRDEGSLIRMEVRLVGADPRVELRDTPFRDDAEIAAVRSRLAQIDRRADSPWTASVLELIGRHPGVLASRLAKKAGMDAAPFKRRVRALKELGLTESLEIGYRLSPRGQQLLEWK